MQFTVVLWQNTRSNTIYSTLKAPMYLVLMVNIQYKINNGMIDSRIVLAW